MTHFHLKVYLIFQFLHDGMVGVAVVCDARCHAQVMHNYANYLKQAASLLIVS